MAEGGLTLQGITHLETDIKNGYKVLWWARMELLMFKACSFQNWSEYHTLVMCLQLPTHKVLLGLHFWAKQKTVQVGTVSRVITG